MDDRFVSPPGHEPHKNRYSTSYCKPCYVPWPCLPVLLNTIDALQAENARLREHAEALAEALAAVRTQLVDSVYGPFPGGDPRLFTPDYDDNTPEEIGAWKAACEEWERGIGEDRGPSCLTFGDGTAYTGGGFGMGVSQWKHEAVEIIIDPALRAYREASHG